MPSADQSEILSIIGNIYDCVLRPEDWPDVLKKIATRVGGLNASISIQDPLSKTGSFFVDWAVPPDAIRQYNEKYASLNPAMTSGWYCEIDDPISAARYVGPPQYFGSRYAREFLKPLGWGDAIGSHIAKLSNRYGILCIFGPWSKGTFADPEINFVRSLSPHVRRAVEITELLGQHPSGNAIEASVLDLLRPGVILLDRLKRITYCNATAERLISSSSTIGRRGDHLFVKHAEVSAKLATAVEIALTGVAEAIPENGIPLALGEFDGPQLAAWILPLRRGGSSSRTSPSEPRVAIFLQEIGDRAPLAGEHFVRQFAITQSECRVLMLLVQGHDVTEIADWLGTSLPTVRTHLARLFAKTNTRSQAQLVGLAMTALSPARLPRVAKNSITEDGSSDA